MKPEELIIDSKYDKLRMQFDLVMILVGLFSLCAAKSGIILARWKPSERWVRCMCKKVVIYMALAALVTIFLQVPMKMRVIRFRQENFGKDEFHGRHEDGGRSWFKKDFMDKKDQPFWRDFQSGEMKHGHQEDHHGRDHGRDREREHGHGHRRNLKSAFDLFDFVQGALDHGIDKVKNNVNNAVAKTIKDATTETILENI